MTMSHIQDMDDVTIAWKVKKKHTKWKKNLCSLILTSKYAHQRYINILYDLVQISKINYARCHTMDIMMTFSTK